jgi:CheY-like chemotaxis protein
VSDAAQRCAASAQPHKRLGAVLCISQCISGEFRSPRLASSSLITCNGRNIWKTPVAKRSTSKRVLCDLAAFAVLGRDKESHVSGDHASSIFAFIKNYAARAGRAEASPVRILVVDDEDLVRKFVNRVLRQAQYETMVAGDGAEAMEVASKHGPFDLLVTDVMMPKMTGDELARRLRASDPGLKVLYLTGFSDHLFKEKVTLWQDEAYLDKPCSVKGLLEAVSLLLTGKVDAPQETIS